MKKYVMVTLGFLMCLGLMAIAEPPGPAQKKPADRGRSNPCVCGTAEYCGCTGKVECSPGLPGSGLCVPSGPIAAVAGVPMAIAKRLPGKRVVKPFFHPDLGPGLPDNRPKGPPGSPPEKKIPPLAKGVFPEKGWWVEEGQTWRNDETRKTKFFKINGLKYCDDPDCVICFDTVYDVDVQDIPIQKK